jgi:DNA-binding beta-propeller fold protein YncE
MKLSSRSGEAIMRAAGIPALTMLLLAAACAQDSTAPAPAPAQQLPAALPDIRINDTEVYPESVTSSDNGTVYVGSMRGNVYRALPGEAEANLWIQADEANRILTVFGVLADDASGTLWLCSVPNFFGPERSEGISSLMAFDLATGAQRGVYPFPPPASVCNDVAVDDAGTAWVTDTGNGRVFVLLPGADALQLFIEDDVLIGVDGIAFSGDGTLYVNNVRTHQLLRLDRNPDGSAAGVTTLTVSHELDGPDSMRVIAGNRFLQAEGNNGRVSIVTIEGERATLDVLTDEFISTPGATPVGDTAYVIESNIRFLIDPELRGQDPGPFMIYALPLPAAAHR